MSFIEIKNKKNAIEIHNQLVELKRNKSIKPSDCVDILKSTNSSILIQEMMECILELSNDEIIAFRDVIISSFIKRGYNDKKIYLSKEIARRGGFEQDFEEYPKDEYGWYYTENSANSLGKNEKGDDKYIYANYKDYKELKILDSKYIDLIDAKYLPNKIDFSKCMNVNIQHSKMSNVRKIIFNNNTISNFNMTSMPENGEFNKGKTITFEDCNFTNSHQIKITDANNVIIKKTRELNNILPEILIISNVNRVEFNNIDFCSVKELILRNINCVVMTNCKGYTKSLDFSFSNNVKLYNCNLNTIKDIWFKEQSIVDLSKSYNFPNQLDISKCSKVNFLESNLKNIESLIISEDKRVYNITKSIGFSGEITYKYGKITTY